MYCNAMQTCCGINEFGGFDSIAADDCHWDRDFNDDKSPTSYAEIKTKAQAVRHFRKMAESDEGELNPSMAFTVDPAHTVTAYKDYDWPEVERVLKLAGFRVMKEFYNPNHGNHLKMWYRQPFAREKK